MGLRLENTPPIESPGKSDSLGYLLKKRVKGLWQNRGRGKIAENKSQDLEPKVDYAHLESSIKFVFSTAEEAKIAAKKVMGYLTDHQFVQTEIDELALSPDSPSSISWDYIGVDAIKTDLIFTILGDNRCILSINKVRSANGFLRSDLERILNKKSLLAEAVVGINFVSDEACKAYLDRMGVDMSENLLNEAAQTQAYRFLVEKILDLQRQQNEAGDRKKYPMDKYTKSDKPNRDNLFQELCDDFFKTAQILDRNFVRSLVFSSKNLSETGGPMMMQTRCCRLVLLVPNNIGVADSIVVGDFGGRFDLDQKTFVLDEYPTQLSIYIEPKPEHGLDESTQSQDQINLEAARLARQYNQNLDDFLYRLSKIELSKKILTT